MSALASSLGVLRFQLQIGRIGLMALIAVATAVCCSPVLVHGEARGGLPTLAHLVFAGFIIAAPLLVHGAEPCLRGMPISPARQRLCSYLAMLLISWLGMLAAMLQLPFTTAPLHEQGWPTCAGWIGDACTAPFWVMLMVPIAAILRHRLRVLAVIAAVVVVLATSNQLWVFRLVLWLRAALIKPASFFGGDSLSQSILLGGYGVVIAAVMAIWPRGSMESRPPSVAVGRVAMLRPGHWGGTLRGLWEAVISQTIARLMAPLGARTRMGVLVLVDSTSFWIVLAILVLILAVGQHLNHPTMAPGILLHLAPFLMAAVLVGAWQVTAMTQRLCLQALLSRQTALLVALAAGPLLILCACAALSCWRPLVSTYPGVGTTPAQYFAAVFPQSSSVALPSGQEMSIDDYVQLLSREHVVIDPSFTRSQCLANWRIAAHSAALQVPEPLLHPNPALIHRLPGVWISAESFPWRPVRGSHTLAYALTDAQLQATMESELHLREEMARIARVLAVLGSAAAGACFLLLLALVMPGLDRLVFAAAPMLLPATSLLRRLTWAQFTGGALLLVSIAMMAWDRGPVPIRVGEPLPPVPVTVVDHILMWSAGHAGMAAAIIVIAMLLAAARLRHTVRTVPLR